MFGSFNMISPESAIAAQSMFGMSFINLSGTYFLQRKRVADRVRRWCETHKGKPSIAGIHDNEWCPILYDWEIVKSTAKKLRDRGHLIFTDLTLTRFLCVMCFGPKGTSCGHENFEDDYATMVKTNAHRFLCLAKYLSDGDNKPLWIRATYTTLGTPIHPEFFKFGAPTNDPSVPVWHIGGDDLIPSLLPQELERVDNLIAQSSWTKQPSDGLRKEVIGKKEDKPGINVYRYANTKTAMTCGNCAKVGEKMPVCSRCKLVRYCNKECQAAAWKMHRNICKAAAK